MKKFIICIALTLICLSACASEATAPETASQAPVSESSQPIDVAEEQIGSPTLIVNSEPEKYAYEHMEKDLQSLQNSFGDILQVKSLAQTADGRNIYDAVLGNPDSENRILIIGAMHAREYITAQLVMRQLCECAEALASGTGEYKGISITELFNSSCIHFVPMSNPDGVAVSQYGPAALHNDTLKANLLDMGSDDYTQWKANAEGVDINRNFDAGWDEFNGARSPGSERYKGEFPGSSAEAAALIALTQDNNFKRTVSYHTCGALIYWYYKQSGTVLDESRRFTQIISEETGYTPDDDYHSVDAAGYKDWAVYKMGIPSITIEVGAENNRGITNPVPMDRFDEIWSRNKNVPYAALYSLKADGI